MMHPRSHFGLQFFAQYNMLAQRVDLFMAQDNGQYVPMPVTMKTRESEGSMVDPLLSLREIEAQGLFDALWQAGLRPSNKAAVDDVVAAKDEHIADLRRVAFEENKA